MPLDPGLDIILWLQSGPDWFLSLMKWVSVVGQGGFYLLAIALVFWTLDRSAGARLFLFLTFSGAINSLAKMALHMPRPYWLDSRVRPLELHSSYGMPSGHSQTAAVTWGSAAWLFGRRRSQDRGGSWRASVAWVWSAALLAVFVIGLSRVALGVHSPAQVLVGWVLGFSLLAGFVVFDRKAWPVLSQWKTGTLAFASLALVMGALGAGIAFHWALRNWSVPQVWAAAAGKPFGPDPLPLKDLFRSSGAFLGFALGALWTSRAGRWQLPDRWRARMAELVIGAAGLGLVLGLGVLLGHRVPGGGPVSHLWHFSRSFVAGIWVAGVSPWLAARIGP